MPAEPPRWLLPLLTLIAANLLIAAVIRSASLLAVARGTGGGWTDYVSAVGALLVIPLLALVPVVWRHIDAKEAAARDDRAARQRIHAELEALADNSHDWLWHTDEQLTIRWSSPAVATLLGHRPDQLVGRSMLGLLHPDDIVSFLALTTRATAGPGWRDVELTWLRADKGLIRLQGSGEAIVDGGRVVGFRGARRAAAVVPTPGPDVEAARTRIGNLLAARDVKIALQPIVDLDSGRLRACEALARFSDGRGPDAWFADAGLAGAGNDLELLAVEQAIALLDAGHLGQGIALSLNASPSLILDPRLRDTLTRLGTDLTGLTIELTEHAAVTVYDDIHEALAPLRERGMRLAVDDTGAGYSSFAHVLRLRPDVIKLDRSLVAGIDTDAARRAVVTAIVILALELDATVTGEGVETEGELTTLRDLGVDHGQGYYLGRPDASTATWRAWPGRTWTIPRTTASRRPSDLDLRA